MTGVARVAVLPAAPVLLPGYAGLVDPVPALRAACRNAVRWLVEDPSGPVVVLCADTSPVDARGGTSPPRGLRLARLLLAGAGHTGAVRHLAARDPAPPPGDDVAVLALADGSARRSERAPGHVDERAVGYDGAVGAALRGGDLAVLRRLDLGLGEELLAEGAPVLRVLAGWVERVEAASLTYDDDPFGVQYWVALWRCAAVGDS